MVREVEHRAKSMLAVVQSSVRLSVKTTPEGHALAAAFDGRIGALSRVQPLLTASGWLDADLATPVRNELTAFERDAATSQHVVQGPSVRLSANIAQSLSMLIHELATNGALSAPQGCVTVRWSVDGPVPCLSWIEEGGPKLEQAPVRRGFGTILINTMVQQQWGGTLPRRWETGGLGCEIRAEIPFSAAQTGSPCEPPSCGREPRIRLEHSCFSGFILDAAGVLQDKGRTLRKLLLAPSLTGAGARSIRVSRRAGCTVPRTAIACGQMQLSVAALKFCGRNLASATLRARGSNQPNRNNECDGASLRLIIGFTLEDMP